MSMEGFTGLKVLSLTPILAVADLPLDTYEKGGIIALLVLAVVAIWREGNRRQDKLEGIIDRNTKALSEAAEVDRENTAVLVEVKDAILTCRSKDEKRAR
jgi:hypothetical protein